MRVNHALARRPRENSEAPVLRRDERDGVSLVVHELRRGEVPRAAERRRMADRWRATFDRLGNGGQFHRR